MIQDTKQFFEKCVPSPTEKNKSTQLGVHVEEVAECFEMLSSTDMTVLVRLEYFISHAKLLSEALKETNKPVFITSEEGDKENFLKELCDQIVTATGVAHMFGYDIVGAFQEVNRSNNSKFDENGEPIFDENQKITKGPLYKPANLKEYI